MITKHVVVLPYNEQWKHDFLQIKTELTNVLGQLTIEIEHVGSTSVQGLSAKPIIDIDVVIKDYTGLENAISALGKIGYQHEGNLGIAGREAFKYDGKEHLRKHHLYVCPEDFGRQYRTSSDLGNVRDSYRRRVYGSCRYVYRRSRFCCNI